MRLVAYHRVSTARQGRSGLGLEAQNAALEALARDRGADVIATFTEVESGKRSDRPELIQALNHARLTGATLAIAKLDRLSRNAAFVFNLRDSGVHFIAADMPEANDITVGIMALVAQQEREAIAKRTREALFAANADAFAAQLAPILADIRARGCISLRDIAGELNRRGIVTRRGGTWHVSNVKNLIERIMR